ncbi:membrane protein [Arthrobacter phage Racecar]|nr:hypothetical protein PBI_RACECAR_65 [Arthrobacter phage Racecar]
MLKVVMWVGNVLVAVGTVIIMVLGVSLLVGGQLQGLVPLFLGIVSVVSLIGMVRETIRA